MALLKKSVVPVPYTVPSLEDVDPDYAALVSRRGELLGRQNELNVEHRTLSKAIKADNTPAVRPGVAALLGDADAPDSRAVKSQRLAIVAGQLRDLDTAVEVLRQRIATARTHARVSCCVQCSAPRILPPRCRGRQGSGGTCHSAR